LQTQMKSLGGLSSPTLWDAYMSFYDRATSFSDGYHQILLDAHKELPLTGTIVDYGGGTGTHSAGLLYFSSKRRIVTQDISEKALKIAATKLKLIDPSEKQFLLLNTDLNHYEKNDEKTKHADGALLSNVLYAISRNEKPRVLKRIWNDLKDSGILVIHDPLPSTQNDSKKLKLFLEKIFTEAFKNQSPATDYEFAFLAEINRSKLSDQRRQNPFLSFIEMRELLEQSGFKVLSQKISYYGEGQLLIAQKKQP